MIGAIIGDIVGSRFEFSKIRNKSENFELFTKFNKFTDDTVMTIATADCVLHGGNFEDYYWYWGNRYPNAGYGGRFRGWLNSKNRKPYYSFGNGSAMRVSPIGWLYSDISLTLYDAETTAKCTHNHPEGIKGAQSVACAIHMARQKCTKEQIKEYIISNFNYNLNRTIDEIRPTYRFEVSCQASVPESIICFLEGNSYEDVIRKTVSLAGDTDTQACIAGSIAEAYYGVPDGFVEIAYKYLPTEMSDIVKEFRKTY